MKNNNTGVQPVHWPYWRSTALVLLIVAAVAFAQHLRYEPGKALIRAVFEECQERAIAMDNRTHSLEAP